MLGLKVLGEEHEDTIATYNTIATHFHYMGHYSKAIEYYEKTVVGFEKLFGADNPKLALVIGNLASAYGDMRNYDKAMELNQKALDILLASLGESHVDTVFDASKRVTVRCTIS